MKLLKITCCYPEYHSNFYKDHPGLKFKTFAEQKSVLDYDAFGWADFWSNALEPLGYDVLEVTLNANFMQNAWMQENVHPNKGQFTLQEIALAQVKHFKPDILWYDHSDCELLSQIRSEVPSLRLIIGWTGSAIPVTDAWQHMDIVLSCAPESVDKLRESGIHSEQLHHGFDPRINNRLKLREKHINFSFIGQLVRSSQYHLEREQLLLELAHQSGICIFSPSAEFGVMDDLKSLLMSVCWRLNIVCNKFQFSETLISRIPLLNRVLKWHSSPIRPVNSELKQYIQSGVYGLEMFQVLHDSKIVLNVHADSSPRFASNMRLFETTGVGTCMLVDWKENLKTLFDTDKEVVTYKSVGECVEKMKWLMDHAEEREAIGKAGQLRTLTEHSYANRALMLNEIIRRIVF